MYATTPPTENAIAARAAILELAREKVAQLTHTPEDLAALPAWLWSLPAHEVARSLVLDPHLFCREIAQKIDLETTRRCPAEKYVAFLATHHPHLSNVQRARLAEFAYQLDKALRSAGAVTTWQMVKLGFTEDECAAYSGPGLKLIEAFDKAQGDPAPRSHRNSIDALRDAGNRAHARRALAEGDLEFDAAAASRVAGATEAAQAAR